MASNFTDEGLPANEDGDHGSNPPSRPGGTGRPAHFEARAELRDRETYYAELRFAVHCESRSVPVNRDGGTEGESWDEMIARFGDTWT